MTSKLSLNKENVVLGNYSGLGSIGHGVSKRVDQFIANRIRICAH